MNAKPDQLQRVQAAMAEIAQLPVEDQVEASLHVLSTLLARAPLEELRARRAAFLSHFSHCGCSFETGQALLEWIDLHLAAREKQAALTLKDRGRTSTPRALPAVDNFARNARNLRSQSVS